MISIIAQRLFDVLILCSLFAISLFGAIDAIPLELSVLISVTVLVCAVSVLLFLEQLLSICANLLLGKSGLPATGARRALIRIVLQARIWQRHRRKPGLNTRAGLLTLAKWSCTLLAISILFRAVATPLDGLDAMAASAAYNFLAVVPLQTIGGLGIGEVGLTAILVAMGLGLSLAVGVSLFVRIILIFFPFLFFGLVFIWRTVFQKKEFEGG